MQKLKAKLTPLIPTPLIPPLIPGYLDGGKLRGAACAALFERNKNKVGNDAEARVAA